MVARLKLIFKLFALYGKMDFLWFTQDTLNCVLIIVSDTISALSGVTGLFLLSQRFGGVGSLSSMEVLFMLGFYTMAGGILFVFMGNYNTLQISRRVGRGQVDHMLIQPVPLSVQLLTEGFVPVSGISALIAGLVIVVYSLNQLSIAITPLWVLSFALFVIARAGIEVGLSFLFGAAAFYRPVSCEEISSVALDSLLSIGQYPLSGLPPIVIDILVTVFPAGLMAWLPAMVLLNKTDAGIGLLLPLTVAAVLLALAQYAFRKGLRYYAKIGSNRYRTVGFRN